MTTSWKWKPKKGQATGLLYEPGNWGDILKASFALTVARWLFGQGGAEAFSCLDSFAGAPEYPLTSGCRRRLEALGDLTVARVFSHFLPKGIWPSTASLLAAELKDTGVSVEVFDADRVRLNGYRTRAGFEVLEGECGYSLAMTRGVRPLGLVLVDPYDLLKDWERLLPGILARTEEVSLLLYIYNRAGRGRADFDRYRTFRRTLSDQWGERPRLLGRVAGDPFLPQTSHEMLFLPARSVAMSSSLTELFDHLERETKLINDEIHRQGMVERF